MTPTKDSLRKDKLHQKGSEVYRTLKSKAHLQGKGLKGSRCVKTKGAKSSRSENTSIYISAKKPKNPPNKKKEEKKGGERKTRHNKIEGEDKTLPGRDHKITGKERRDQKKLSEMIRMHRASEVMRVLVQSGRKGHRRRHQNRDY